VLFRSYTVVKGDNLTRIASRNGTTVAELVRINGIKNANLINVGQVIKLR
jgi:LysM repeat protein